MDERAIEKFEIERVYWERKGIEIQEHVDELSKGGCIFGQGYYYSRPLKVEAFEHYINWKRGLQT